MLPADETKPRRRKGRVIASGSAKAGVGVSGSVKAGKGDTRPARGPVRDSGVANNPRPVIASGRVQGRVGASGPVAAGAKGVSARGRVSTRDVYLSEKGQRQANVKAKTKQKAKAREEQDTANAMVQRAIDQTPKRNLPKVRAKIQRLREEDARRVELQMEDADAAATRKTHRPKDYLPREGEHFAEDMGPLRIDRKPEVRHALIEKRIQREDAAQEKKDDESIKTYGTFERDTPPQTGLEKAAAKRKDRKLKAVESKVTPRTRKTFDRLEKFGGDEGAQEVQATKERMARTGERSVSKRQADVVEKAVKRGEDEEALKKKRSRLGSVPGNLLRDVKDSLNVIPVVQEFAKAGQEQMNALVPTSGGGRRATPHSDAIVKGFIEEDPIVQTVKHGPKAGLQAAVRHPLGAIGDVTIVGRGVTQAGRLARAGGSVSKMKARDFKVRARPTQRLENTPLPKAKGKAGRARLKRDVAATRRGQSPQAARATGHTRQYSGRITVRAAQKAKDNLQATRGHDPVRPTGRKADRIEHKQMVSYVARRKNVNRTATTRAKNGEAVDVHVDPTHLLERPAPILDQIRGTSRTIRDLEHRADHKTKIVSGELFGHIHPQLGTHPRIRTLSRNIDDGTIRRREYSARAAELREAGETNEQRIRQLATDHADAQVQHAKATHDALVEADRAVQRIHAAQQTVDQLKMSRRPVAATLKKAEKELAAAKKNGAWVQDAHDIARGRTAYGEHLDRQQIDSGELGDINADLRLRQQLGVANGFITHDPQSPTGWRVPGTSGDTGIVTMDDIARMPRAKGYINYGRNASGAERVVGRQGPGKGFTGVGVHGHDWDTRDLGEIHGHRVDKLGQNALADEFLRHSVGGAEGRLRSADADAVAEHMTQTTGQDWVPVKAGRVAAHEVQEARLPGMGPRGLPKPGPGEDGFVVMPKAAAKLWDAQMKPVGRMQAGSQMVTRQFLRGVLGLNPGWIAGNLTDSGMRVAVAGARPRHWKIAKGLEREAGLTREGEAANPLPEHPAAAEVLQGLPGHAGSQRDWRTVTMKDVFNSGKLADGTPAAGILTKVGEGLHRVGKPWTGSKLKHGFDQLVDASLDFSAHQEAQFIRGAQGVAAERLAAELQVGTQDLRGLAKRILEDPAAADRFHEITLGIIGDYIRHSPKTRMWQAAGMPFLPWLKAAARWTMYTLPKDHPVKVALYLQAAKATEQQRRLLGMSDWITRSEARSLGLPDPVSGFLNGAANVAPGWASPVQTLFSFGEVGRQIEDPVGHFTRHIFPQVSGIAARAQGHANNELDYRISEATDAAGLTENAAHKTGSGALEAALRIIQTYVPGAAKAIGMSGLAPGIQGGLGPMQTGSYDENGGLTDGRPKNIVGDILGLGAQSITTKMPNIAVQGLRQAETGPQTVVRDPVTGEPFENQTNLVYDEVTGSYGRGLVPPKAILDAAGKPIKEQVKDTLLAHDMGRTNVPRVSQQRARVIGGPSKQVQQIRELTDAINRAVLVTNEAASSAKGGPAPRVTPGRPAAAVSGALTGNQRKAIRLQEQAHQLATSGNVGKARDITAKVTKLLGNNVIVDRENADGEQIAVSGAELRKQLTGGKPTAAKAPSATDLRGRLEALKEMPAGPDRDREAIDLMGDVKRHRRWVESQGTFDDSKVTSLDGSPVGQKIPASLLTPHEYYEARDNYGHGSVTVPHDQMPKEPGPDPQTLKAGKRGGRTIPATKKVDRTPDTRLTGGQQAFVDKVSKGTGLSPAVVAAWALAEESSDAAKGREAEGNHNWLNIGYFDSLHGKGALQDKGDWSTPEGAARETIKFLKGQKYGPSAGIRKIIATKGMSEQEQIAAIARSGWASSGYGGGQTLLSLLNSATPGAGSAVLSGGPSPSAGGGSGSGSVPMDTASSGTAGAGSTTTSGSSTAAAATSTAPRKIKAQLTAQLEAADTGTPEERSAKLAQLLATLNGGYVNEQGETILPRKKARVKRRSAAASSNIDPMSSESKRARARIKTGK